MWPQVYSNRAELSWTNLGFEKGDFRPARGPVVCQRAHGDTLKFPLVTLRGTGVPRPSENTTPPRTPLGPYAQAYSRVLGGVRFIMSEVPLYAIATCRVRSVLENKLTHSRGFHPDEHLR